MKLRGSMCVSVTKLLCGVRDVIPQIVLALADLRTTQLQKIAFPTNCPDCDSTLTRDLEEAAVRCENTTGCPAQQKAALEHYVSR